MKHLLSLSMLGVLLSQACYSNTPHEGKVHTLEIICSEIAKKDNENRSMKKSPAMEEMLEKCRRVEGLASDIANVLPPEPQRSEASAYKWIWAIVIEKDRDAITQYMNRQDIAVQVKRLFQEVLLTEVVVSRENYYLVLSKHGPSGPYSIRLGMEAGGEVAPCEGEQIIGCAPNYLKIALCDSSKNKCIVSYRNEAYEPVPDRDSLGEHMRLLF